MQQEVEASASKTNARKLASRTSLEAGGGGSYPAPTSASRRSHDQDSPPEHVPHSICQYSGWPLAMKEDSQNRLDQTTGHRLNVSLQSLNRRVSVSHAASTSPFPMIHHSPISSDSVSGFFPPSRLSAIANLPYFIKPLPPRIGADEITYLEKKGALTVPSVGLRNEMLKAYIEFVHPFMPLLDLYDFVMIIESGNGSLGRISLILFQAVMFAGSAFVDMHHLHNAGYATRKEARKDFFQKTRVRYCCSGTNCSPQR